MAIRINAGQAPRLGRITMPRGTFLSDQNPFDNPSGAADGSLGGPQGNNVSMWGNYVPGTNLLKSGSTLSPRVNPFGMPQTPQIGASNNPLTGRPNPSFNQSDIVVTGQKQLFYNELGQPVEYEQHSFWNGKETVTYNPVVHDARGNRYTWDANKKDYVRDETGILSPKPNATPAHSLVGQDLISTPEQMTAKQAQAVTGLTGPKLAEWMMSHGYGERRYQAGVGEVFIRTGEQQAQGGSQPSAFGGGFDERGRPEYVDGAALLRGETVTNSRGFTYRGGIPYTDKKTGVTVGQYSVTTPGPKNDPKGMFKWKSTTQKDSNGNWVRVYSQELRKVYSRRSRRMREDDDDRTRRDKARNQAPGRATQLVNLRMNYG